jgi:Zn-dependent peptidase ImmA (M78 family)
VACDEMGTTALDGLCNWSKTDGRPYMMLANDKMSFFRRQMDAAHEMSHAIIHRNVTAEELRRDFTLIERQAFRLASAFLLPASGFAMAVGYPTLSGLLTLKDQWRVSVKAMIRRCRDLDLVDDDGQIQLYKYYSAKGWNREEPLDRSTTVAQPRLLAQAIGMIADSGRRTKDELVSWDFTIPARDIEELVALPAGWFGRETGQVVHLRLNSNVRAFNDPGDQSAEVVPFSSYRDKTHG